MTTLLFVILMVLLLGAIPVWPYNHSWGYWPSGIIGLVVLLLIVFIVFGR